MSRADAAKVAVLTELRKALEERRAPGRDASGERWPSGHAALDAAIGGGLFVGSLNEVHVATPGTGIVEALLPGLATHPEGAPRDGRVLAWVHPYSTPYPPALAQAGLDLSRWLIVRPGNLDDHLWAVEQTLRSGACRAMVAHLGEIPDIALRRLHLAAQEGRCLALLLRPMSALGRTSPAALRFGVHPLAAPSARRRRVHLDITRCRGRAVVPPVLLEWSLDPLADPVVETTRLHEAQTFGKRGSQLTLRRMSS